MKFHKLSRIQNIYPGVQKSDPLVYLSKLSEHVNVESRNYNWNISSASETCKYQITLHCLVSCMIYTPTHRASIFGSLALFYWLSEIIFFIFFSITEDMRNFRRSSVVWKAILMIFNINAPK
jgi:hypothetical protein